MTKEEYEAIVCVNEYLANQFRESIDRAIRKEITWEECRFWQLSAYKYDDIWRKAQNEYYKK